MLLMQIHALGVTNCVVMIKLLLLFNECW